MASSARSTASPQTALEAQRLSGSHSPANAPIKARTEPRNPDKPWFACTPFGLDYFEHAPVRFENSVDLPLTPSELFEVFEEEASWSAWVPGITRVEWTSPKPFAPGTTRTVTFVGGMEVYEEFMDWQQGESLAFCLYGTSQDVWESFGERYRVEDLGGGRARLTWVVAYEPRGAFKTLHPLIRPFMGRTLAWFMQRLGTYCSERAAF